MKNTRFMEVMFSAVENKDEELTNQVAKDIEDAASVEGGVVDTDEVKYENAGNGKVNITDKETGEVTVAEKASDEDGTYDLYPAEVSEQIEGFVHPESDGVTPGAQVGTADEHVEDHMTGEDVIAPNQEDGGLNPEAGHEVSVEETAQLGPEEACEEGDCEEEKEFSVSTDNTVVLRIFSDQAFCERLFSEVIESEETAKVGDLKIEKLADEENTVVVTNESTGDQAKVKLEDEEMEVTELESKSFSEAEQFNALHVVGVDAGNHVIVDAPEYSEESAQELVARLSEQGVDALQIFACPEEARDYAIELLNGLCAEELEEPVQAEFSDHTINLTKFYSSNTDFMCRMFSEACNDIDASQDAIEDAIENGDEIETDTEIITPVDSKSAVVKDKENGEFTKVSLDGEEMNLNAISKEEAEELTSHLEVSEEGEDEEEKEKEFSEIEDQIWCNEEETKFFSESETMTSYMIRLFSEESDSAEIEEAIESGEQIENDTEIITPIDSCTAIVEDKENGEFTKAVMDDEKLDVQPISEEEADKLTEGLEVEDKEDEEGEEKKFAYVEDPILDKFFSGVVAAAPANTAMFTIDENGNPIAPVGAAQEVAPAVEEAQAVPTVESIEDKALAAVQSIQAAASEAEAAIMNAKAAPIEGAEEDLKEAQFSNKNTIEEGTLLSWLNGNNKYRK